MFKSGSTTLVKNLNKKHILNLVRMQPGITARKISDITGLQISTVLYTLKSLRSENIIRESGMGVSAVQGGKPPVMWKINADYGYVLGAEILSSELRLIILDFRGQLIAQKIYPLPETESGQHVSSLVQNAINQLLAESAISVNRVLGLGAGISGTIDNREGMIVYSQKQSFHNLPFRKMLSANLPFPLEIDNEANAAALGIKWLNSDEFETAHILYVSIQQNFKGMGVGIIIDHKLYRGANGAAGEISSFLPANFWQRVCRRVADDCLFCSPASLQSGQSPDISVIIGKARENEADAVYILRELAKEISKKLVLLVDLFNPMVLVIGGDICEAQLFIRKVISERLKARVISEAARQTRLLISPFGSLSGAYGGAALIFKKIFG